MKIGIFGGSFNPIHIGHAIIANYAITNCDIDQLWIMVSPQNPLKKENDEVSDFHRLRMAEYVSRRILNVTTSAFEFSLPRPSYTYDTLQALSNRFPNDEFCLIIGADNWQNFKSWKNYDLILSNYKIYVYPRLGFHINIPDEYKQTVFLLNSPIIEISSTKIRELVKFEKNTSFYLPDDVYRYIIENKLYLTK